MSRKQLRPKPTIGRHAQDRIGRELRAMYDEVLREPLPEDLASVVRALQETEVAKHRLKAAVLLLQRAKIGLVVKPDANCGAPFVHTQQRLIELSMQAARSFGSGARPSQSRRKAPNTAAIGPSRLTVSKRSSTG